MGVDLGWLPPLMLFDDYDGNWDRYLTAIYAVFKKDFVDSKPGFPGKRFALKRYPIQDGKEATFWHMTSEGTVEENRRPDFRKCERIRWPRPIIESLLMSGRVVSWKNKRKRDVRILIALPDFSYLVVLSDRKEYVLLWTAYPVERDHLRRKLRNEYDAWIRTQKG